MASKTFENVSTVSEMTAQPIIAEGLKLHLIRVKRAVNITKSNLRNMSGKCKKNDTKTAPFYKNITW